MDSVPESMQRWYAAGGKCKYDLVVSQVLPGKRRQLIQECNAHNLSKRSQHTKPHTSLFYCMLDRVSLIVTRFKSVWSFMKKEKGRTLIATQKPERDESGYLSLCRGGKRLNKDWSQQVSPCLPPGFSFSHSDHHQCLLSYKMPLSLYTCDFTLYYTIDLETCFLYVKVVKKYLPELGHAIASQIKSDLIVAYVNIGGLQITWTQNVENISVSCDNTNKNPVGSNMSK